MIRSIKNRVTEKVWNREQVLGDRAGQYSIRINNQYRICFFWADGDADEVEITDYH